MVTSEPLLHLMRTPENIMDGASSYLMIIYGGLGAVEVQTLDNTKISTRTVIDDIVYDQSEEMHWIRLRQQDPSTSLWSMCEVRTFSSKLGARTSICVDWLYTGVTF